MGALKELEQRTLGDVVAEDYRRAVVLQRFGIDFCCGGGRGVREACEESGVAYEDVARALTEPVVGGSDGRSDAEWELDELAAHIVTVHHGYVREALPALSHLSEKVARVHGGRHAELEAVRVLVAELAAELDRHMDEEERELFPWVVTLVAARQMGARPEQGGAESRGPVADPIAGLEDDHERAGEILRRLRELSGGYVVPADGCTSYRALYAQLEELERDLHRHVHLENNVLFPRARALAASLAAGVEAGA